MLCVLHSYVCFDNFWEETTLKKNRQFSTAIPPPLVIILAGLLSLWVFIIPYILPGFTSFGLINCFQFTKMALRLTHFSIHVLILFSYVFVGLLMKRVFIILYILPGFTSFGLINCFQFTKMALRLTHFSINVLILFSYVFVGLLMKRVYEFLFI